MSSLTDLSVAIRLAGGRREKVTVPPDMKTDEFVEQLVEGLNLPGALDDKGGVRWRLIDPGTGLELQADQTLEGNLVHAGQELLLEEAPLDATVLCPRCGAENSTGNRFCRRCREPLGVTEPTTIRVIVHKENDEGKPYTVRPEIRTEELLSLVVGHPVKDADREDWALHSKDTGRDLLAGKTMAENMVQSGQQIYLRRRVQPGPLVKPSELSKAVPVQRMRWSLIAAAAVILVLLVGGVVALVRGGGGSLTLTPSSAELSAGGLLKLNAMLKDRPAEVRWTISPELGTISANGLYEAPHVVGSRAGVEVMASLAKDATKFAVTRIELEPGHEVVKLMPETATLEGAGNAQFTATVSGGSDPRVRWSIQPEAGSISPDGLYTAPVTVSQEQKVEVKAASVTNPNQTATSQVVIEPVVVNLKPRNATVNAQANLRVVAAVDGSANKGVTWTLDGPGELSKAGVYAAPGNLSAPVTARVTATSVADASKSASMSVTVQPVVGVSVLPASGTVTVNQRVRFTAALTGTTKTAVRWTLSGPGTLSADGEYQAPATLASDGVARIRVTSEADPSKSAESVVKLVPVSVAITPTELQLQSAQWNWFRASVNGVSSQAVRWSLSGRGTLSQQGIYTSPGLINADQTVMVKATSTLDPTRSATATIRLKRYAGPLSGTLTWTGTPDEGGGVTIEASSAMPGALSGELFPALPIEVQINNKDYTIVQRPALSNAWKRLTLTTKKRKASVVKITWKVTADADTQTRQ